jgi:tetratricopeptide (TPR) repeat protein
MGKKSTRRVTRPSDFPQAKPVPISASAWLGSRHWLALFAAAIVASLIVFAPALKGPFVFDDLHLPFADPHAVSGRLGFWIGGVRPVLMLTYWVNFVISGTHPLGYHLMNIGFHAANALLVFFILERLFAISGAAFDQRIYAFAGAAIFLLHPLQTEAVDYIAGRSEIVAGFFFLAGWLVFLRSFEKKSGFILTLVLCFLTGLAVESKENAVSLPAILLLTDFCFPAHSLREQLRSRWKLYSILVTGGVAVGVRIVLSLKAAGAAGFSTGISPFAYALTQCRTILTYVRLFVIPLGQNGDWALPFYHSIFSGAAVIWMAGLLLLLAFAIWTYKRDRLVFYGLGVFFLILAPTSSIIPIADAMAERRMYLPIIGLIVVLLYGVARFASASPWRWKATTAALLACAFLSWNRSEVWASPLTFWENSVAGNSVNSRAHHGVGVALMSGSQCATAAREFKAARELAPSNSDLLWDLAEAYQCANNYKMALDSYQAFIKVRPTAEAYAKVGLAEAKLGNADAAQAAVATALSMDSQNADAYAYRGFLRLALDTPAAARSDFERALQLDPQNVTALKGISMLQERH